MELNDASALAALLYAAEIEARDGIEGVFSPLQALIGSFIASPHAETPTAHMWLGAGYMVFFARHRLTGTMMLSASAQVGIV